jgi:hypothetical protein
VWRTARAGLALLGWIALVVWLTWPLASVAATHGPIGPGTDSFYSMWALAWQVHALATAPARFFDANIYHPVATTLAYGPTGTGALVLFGPVFAASRNPILAANVLFLGGSALTAWTIGLVTSRWTRSAAAGLVAGATYLATPWVLRDWVPRCTHFAMLMWVPLIIERASRPSLRWRDALALAVMVALQAAVEIVYIAPAVLIPLALVMLARLGRRTTRRCGLRLGMALVAAALAVSPLIAAHAAVRQANPQLSRQTTWRARGTPAARPAPQALWSLFGWEREAATNLTAPPPMALPPLAFGLIACGVVRRQLRRRRDLEAPPGRAWRHAAFWTATAIVLAALPFWVLLLGTTIDLPRLWLWETLPVLRVLRVPSRLGVVGLVGLCLLAGLAFGEIAGWALRRWRGHPWSRALGAALAALVVVALFDEVRRGWGYPPGFAARPRLSRYPVYKMWATTVPYGDILTKRGGALLEMSSAVFASPTSRPEWESVAMIRSIGHWRPLLNGYSSYWPRQYKRSLLLARRLPEDLGALATLRDETGLELILVWPKQLPARKRHAWAALVRSGGNAAFALVGSEEQGAFLFRVVDSRASPSPTGGERISSPASPTGRRADPRPQDGSRVRARRSAAHEPGAQPSTRTRRCANRQAPSRHT